MAHTLNDHITPDILAQLEDKSDEAKFAKINKIIGHISEETDNPEVIYAAGIGHYFLGEYEQCMELQEAEIHKFDDEMAVASIYWHTMAAWRCGKEPTLLNTCYKIGMDVGHHRSYNKICALASGRLSLESAELIFSKMFQPLEISIFGYGLACYYEHLGFPEKAEQVKDRIVSEDGFWITYCYLAAWNDKNKKQPGAL